MAPFSRLVRFLGTDGRTLYGDAILPHGTTDISLAKQAFLIQGHPLSPSHTVTTQRRDIRKLLSPLARDDVRTIRCLGLNYEKHARESGMAVPKYPVLFYKPVTALAGPTDPVPIPGPCVDLPGLDYEVELVVVIGKEGREISEAQALSHVAGYTVGNDISHREWQKNRGGGQWSLGKGFDGWAPIGPGIVSSSVIKDPQSLRISTKVNGLSRQDSTTADMGFTVAKLISFLSQGTTLLKGDLIFTGTPEGVGMGMKPAVWLENGDEAEVSIEGIGSCRNRIERDSHGSAKL